MEAPFLDQSIASRLCNATSSINLSSICDGSPDFLTPPLKEILCSKMSTGNLTNSNQLSRICSGHFDFETSFELSENLQRFVSTVVPILFGITVLVGFIGNTLVVLVVLANQQMRSTTNILIFNLALADLLFIIFCVPFTATDYAVPSWPFGQVWCKIVQYLVIVTAYASVYTLVMMSFDRYLAVVHPITSMSIRTERNTYFAIVVLWALILVMCVPVLFAHGIIVYEHKYDSRAKCLFKELEWDLPAFQISFFATSYVIPLGLICTLYLFMLNRLWTGVGPSGHVSAESRRGKKRVTRLVVVVVAIFAVCWLPIQVILVLKSLGKYDTNSWAKVMAQIVSHVLAYMNSCVNPILYAFLSDNFRKAFRKVILFLRKLLSGQGQDQGQGRGMDYEMTQCTRNMTNRKKPPSTPQTCDTNIENENENENENDIL
ncbi:unnamed protein product [Darwinula stevensoni]|uniref:G-protein coupled receptors family 1 profile domain-containing protein n=1 Tax=Darwinula stevensoni TaxID=69355 RepID=A0A7R9A9W3_9CRUS|nr:unnamed protein product [Darwinula stevensoni]CAG0897682.1 unnamed protein product [Darwinula stevensoni]